MTTNKKRRLGRGLEALLGPNPTGESPAPHQNTPQSTSPTDAAHQTSASGQLPTQPTSAEPTRAEPRIIPLRSNPPAATLATRETQSASSSEPATAGDDSRGLIYLDVDRIQENPFQPRRDFSEAEIASLSESIKEHDMLQPILVRKQAGTYQIISGERRWRAAQLAGWTKIPARVREADDRLVAELAIVENLQRKDLNPLEKAMSFRRYLGEHDCSQEDLAGRLKIDRSTIANLMRLLDLPEVVQDALRSGAITAGHARALLPLGDETIQVEFCVSLQREGWSVRETERRVHQRIVSSENPADSPAKSRRKSSKTSPQIEILEQQLRRALGTQVEIRASARGKGKITIHFANNDEFIRIREHLLDDGNQDLRVA